MASTAVPPRPAAISAAATFSPAAQPESARRHLAWLLGGTAVAFLVPFVVADKLGLQRDIYLIVYVAAVIGLFLGWARDTGQSLREMFTRHWRLAVGLGIVFAGVGAVIATAAEGSSPHPGGLVFIGALFWRGVVYGAADGLLLSAFPILLVFAALNNGRLRRRVGGLVVVGAIAMVASLAMTAVYHAGYSDFRSAKLRKPVTGDLVWSAPTLATLNPVGAPIAHVGVHIAAVVHNYDTDLFLPPHAALAGPAAAAPVVPRLPVPEGQYAVGRATLHLIDVKRRDPFKPVRPRELMATVTYPARYAERYPRGPWLGRAVAQNLEAGLSAPPTSPAPGSVDLVGAVAHARLDAPIAQPPGRRARGWPVVLFSPGFSASRQLNTAQIEDLASRGYVVVSIDHTYEAPVVEFPGGRVARQVRGFASEDPKVQRVVFKRAIDARVADMRFVLDRLAALERGRRPDGSQRRWPAGLRGALDLSRVGMFGFSYGGYAAGEAMLYDRRIDAGVNLDGTMAHGFGASEDWPYAPGEVVKRGLDRPFLLFGHTGNNHLGRSGDPSWQQFWATQRGWKLDLTLRGSAHESFSDIQVVAPQIARGLGLPPATFEPVIGTIDPERSISAQRAYIASFFDLHLRGRDTHLLDGPSASFPEVEFVR